MISNRVRLVTSAAAKGVGSLRQRIAGLQSARDSTVPFAECLALTFEGCRTAGVVAAVLRRLTLWHRRCCVYYP